MRYSIFCLFFLFLMGCSLSKKTSERPTSPTKFVFYAYEYREKDRVSGVVIKPDSFLDSLYDPKGVDSLINRSLKEIYLSDLWKVTEGSNHHIEVKNDSIWRHSERSGIAIGAYTMSLKNSGVIHYYDETRQVNHRKFDLFENENEYDVVINKADRKTIQGYDCFKLILVRRETSYFLGNTIYEMYVTDKIHLPVHSVVSVTKLFHDLFPMEVLIKEDFLPGKVGVYRLIEIE